MNETLGVLSDLVTMTTTRLRDDQSPRSPWQLGPEPDGGECPFFQSIS